MADPTTWPPMKVHPRIVKAGIRDYFVAPWDLACKPRGDSQGIFDQLVKSSTIEELEERLQQYVESYSHWMYEIERNMKIEEVEISRQRHLHYDRKLLQTNADLVSSMERSAFILKSERREAAARKLINFGLEEQGRTGALAGMIFKHLLNVRAGSANQSDLLCDCEICRNPV